MFRQFFYKIVTASMFDSFMLDDIKLEEKCGESKYLVALFLSKEISLVER